MADALDLGPCRGCAAEMLWVATINGKLQPLDPVPDPEQGSIVLMAADVEVEGRDEPVTRMGVTFSNFSEKARDAARRQNVRLYTPHHMTCPANQDRRFNRGG